MLLTSLSFLKEECHAAEQPIYKEAIEISSNQKEVKGRVVDMNGEPLIGATILEKGERMEQSVTWKEISFYQSRIMRC